MATVLLVLKIIGIVLLCILAFVLGLIILLLALPFRYKVIAKKTECDSGKITDALKAEVHVTWLLHFIHLSVLYDKTADLFLKIFGIKFLKKNLIGEKKNKVEDDEFDFPDEEYFEYAEHDETDNGKEDKTLVGAKKADKNDAAAVKKLKNNFKKSDDEDFYESDEAETDLAEDSKVDTIEISDSKNSESDNDTSNSESDEYKPDIFDKIGDFIENFSEKAEGFIEKTEDFLSKPAEAADKIIDTYDYYTHLFGTKGAEISIEFLKAELVKILKSLKPRRGYVELDFASEDPEKTAKVYEIYGCVLGYLPKKSKVYIDFEDEHLYFDVWIKGNICLGYLIFHGLKILFNKRLKKFIKLLKREEK